MRGWAGLVGLAARAGKVAAGSTAVEDALRRGNASLVLLAADAGEGSLRNTEIICRKRKVPVFFVGNKDALGSIVGRSPRAAVAILDSNMARAIATALMAEGSSRKGEMGVSGHGQTGEDLSTGPRIER